MSPPQSRGFSKGVHWVTGYLSFIHLTAGEGSPTALQGKAMSFIHGVVTVPLKVRIRAGAGAPNPGEARLMHGLVCPDVKLRLPNAAASPQKGERSTLISTVSALRGLRGVPKGCLWYAHTSTPKPYGGVFSHLLTKHKEPR